MVSHYLLLDEVSLTQKYTKPPSPAPVPGPCPCLGWPLLLPGVASCAGGFSQEPIASWADGPSVAPTRLVQSMEGASQATGSGWCCKSWAGPFPWFEYYLNQTYHAQDPMAWTCLRQG